MRVRPSLWGPVAESFNGIGYGATNAVMAGSTPPSASIRVRFMNGCQHEHRCPGCERDLPCDRPECQYLRAAESVCGHCYWLSMMRQRAAARPARQTDEEKTVAASVSRPRHARRKRTGILNRPRVGSNPTSGSTISQTKTVCLCKTVIPHPRGCACFCAFCEARRVLYS